MGPNSITWRLLIGCVILLILKLSDINRQYIDFVFIIEIILIIAIIGVLAFSIKSKK